MLVKRLLYLTITINIIILSVIGYIVFQRGGIPYVLTTISSNRVNQTENIYYTDRTSLFDQLDEAEDSIVFLGDSLINNCEWGELFKNNNVKNRGINGDTTDGVLRRLDNVIRLHPKQIFTMIGINDIGFHRNKNDIRRDYEKIISKIIQNSPNTELFVESVLPCDYQKYPNRGQMSIIELNKEIKELAAKYNVHYIDLYSLMVSPDGKLNPAFTTDGLHLNGNGYIIWRETIKQYIK